jgi:hypothetical protein
VIMNRRLIRLTIALVVLLGACRSDDQHDKTQLSPQTREGKPSPPHDQTNRCERDADCGPHRQCVGVYNAIPPSTHYVCVTSCSDSVPCPSGMRCKYAPHISIPEGYSGTCFKEVTESR